jgi:hypothetical protein
MAPEDVGMWRFCPSCGRPLMEPDFLSEFQDSEAFDAEQLRCSCC